MAVPNRAIPVPIPVQLGVATVRVAADDAPVFFDVLVRHALHGEGVGPLRVVLGGISATRELSTWWPHHATAGSPLFVDDARVLGIDWIAGLPPAFRGVTPRAQARAVLGVLDALGVERVDAVVGASYGGAVALALASIAPARCRRVLVLCAAHRPSPMSVAQRALQRAIIRLAVDANDAPRGIAIARALAMTTYRTEAEFDARFPHSPRHDGERWRHGVVDYLESRGAAFAQRFDAERYLDLSESLDLHSVEPESIDVPLDLLAVREDRLVPLGDMESLARRANARLHQVSSVAGHDGFITEVDAVARWLRECLSNEADPERMRRADRALVHRSPSTDHRTSP